MINSPPTKKSSASYFDEVEGFLYPINQTWANIKIIWQEKVVEPKESANPSALKQTTIQHIYTPVVDRSSKKGAIYLDCSYKKIYAKICVHLLYRIAAVVLKTLYALILPLSLTVSIYKTIKRQKRLLLKQPNQDTPLKFDRLKITQLCLKNCLRTLQSIVRTPMYEMALLGISIAALAVGIFSPQKLLDFRKVIGQVIKRQEKHTKKHHVSLVPNLFPCLLPLYSLKKAKKWVHIYHDDTEYPIAEHRRNNQIIHGLVNHGRGYVRFKRKFATFGSGKLPQGKAYISPRYQDFQLQDLQLQGTAARE